VTQLARALLAGLLLPILALADAPKNAEGLFSQGREAYQAENYQRAMDLFAEAARLEPGSSRYHHWLGKATGRRAERASFLTAPRLAGKARTAFERAVQLDGSNTAALADLFEYYLEAPGVLGGGEDKARAMASRLGALSPAEGHRAQAAVRIKKKDWVGAEAELRRALELDHENRNRLLDLASFLTDRGRYQEADTLLDRAAEAAPNVPEVVFARARRLVAAGAEPARARQLLEQYLRSERQPDDPPRSEAEALLKKIPK